MSVGCGAAGGIDPIASQPASCPCGGKGYLTVRNPFDIDALLLLLLLLPPPQPLLIRFSRVRLFVTP